MLPRTTTARSISWPQTRFIHQTEFVIFRPRIERGRGSGLMEEQGVARLGRATRFGSFPSAYPVLLLNGSKAWEQDSAATDPVC